VSDGRSEFARRIGVGEPCNSFTTAAGRAPRRRKVVTDEGPRRGTVGGYQTDHPDGRLDAHVFAPTATTSGDLPHPE
jgi:hypothetical protein